MDRHPSRESRISRLAAPVRAGVGRRPPAVPRGAPASGRDLRCGWTTATSTSSGLSTISQAIGEQVPPLPFPAVVDGRRADERRQGGQGTRPGRPSALFPALTLRLFMHWLRRHGTERVNAYVTNVPGPLTPLWLDGARLVSAYPIPR
ncbi:WS/DGAT domain-containing protein [Spongiactinospora sp. TRM90649]|nr:WS/DGAT domain-containing protein [Spongiactinospora sp. TRM90649]MDF5755214.1 WS/DGAT domain-containing protein [Spongiactinospora sp. TRM90649]